MPNPETTVESRIATAFYARIVGRLGAEKLSAVAAANRADRPGVCHTHDHCDANVLMAWAFEFAVGREPDLQSDDDLRVWENAWSKACASIDHNFPAQ